MGTDKDQLIFQGHIIDLAIEEVWLPDGRSFPLEIVRHPGGAAVVALNAKHQVCLLRQYRHVAAGLLWELPAGKCQPGEQALFSAQRELAEEAGLTAQSWQSLGTIWSSPGIFTERIHLFLARNLSECSQSIEEDEYLERHWIEFDEALEWASHGTVADAKSIIGLFRAAPVISAETV